MIQHFAGPVVATLLALWSSVVTHYYEFRHIPTPSSTEPPVVTLAAPSATSTPAPFDIIVTGILERASSTTAQTKDTDEPTPVPRGPVSPTTPSVPFTPLPVPTPPPITPPAITDEPDTEPAEPSPSPIKDFDHEAANEALLKSSIVNIICLPGGGIRGSSGTGIMIDARGIVLTVAHVGQNFLLRDYPTKGAGTCVLRTGSPAKNAYTADLIYLSPQWLDENRATFLSSSAKGTGENDFAILAITGSANGKTLPSSFTYIPLSPAGARINDGDEVGTGSYAAEFLTSDQVRSALYPTIKFAEVNDVYTFSRNTFDIFSVAAGSAAQEGSSGGAVIDTNGLLIGLISTRTVKTDLALRTLQALTMDHIRRSFKADTGKNLDTYLKDASPTKRAGEFTDEAETLLELLRQEIDAAR